MRPHCTLAITLPPSPPATHNTADQMLARRPCARSDGTLDCVVVLELLDALRRNPLLQQAYQLPDGTAPPEIRKILIAIENLADESCCRPGTPPPLTAGAIARIARCETRARFEESWCVQVARHAKDTTADGLYRHRVVLSDGVHEIPALVDSRLHSTLCTGDVVKVVWVVTEAVVHADGVGTDIPVSVIITAASRLAGYHRCTTVHNAANLTAAVHRPIRGPDAEAQVIDDPGIPDEDPEWHFIPATSCDGCGCEAAHAKDADGDIIPDTTYPCNRPAHTCRAPDLPGVAEVWDEMVRNWPRDENEPPYPADPIAACRRGEAGAERACRFALYYHVATNWYDCRGKGNRLMMPTCLWAAIRRAHPERRPGPGYTEEVYVPGDNDESDWEDE